MSRLWLCWTWPLSLAAGAALMALRFHHFGMEGLGNGYLAAALALQFVGYQRMLAGGQPRAMAQGIEWSQWGWFLFALGLPGQGPALASMGFLASQALIKAPLVTLLAGGGLGHPWIILGGFLALVGCLPFSSFSAYFQAFVPLMSVGDAVSTMDQKLFSGAGLWAALVLLSVVYQSCALGYFYWSQIMAPHALRPSPLRGPKPWIAVAGLGLSACFGIFRGIYGALIRSALSGLGLVL